MAVGSIPVGNDKLNTTKVTTSEGIVHNEVIVLADPSDGAAQAKVTNTTPGGSDYGVVVRIAGGGSAVTVADGANVAQGTTTDLAYTSGAGTLISILKGIFGKFGSLGQKNMAGSAPVVIASDQSAISITGTVTANTGLSQPLTDTQLRASPVPVSVSGVATEATLAANTGALTETAPASDTASSGLNGRLQRIAQRLTSLIALLPGSIGTKTSANSLGVVLASDQAAIATNIISGQTGISANAGAVAANTPRITLASDDPLVAAIGAGPGFRAAQIPYFFKIANTVHVAAASTLMWDLFNADPAAIVRVFLIQHITDLETPVTGVGFEWQLLRTTAVGTGGTGQTAGLFDLNDAALSVNITCRLKATGGATAGVSQKTYFTNSEETLAGNQQLGGGTNIENIVPPIICPPFSNKGIVLRQNQGLRLNQETNSAAGNSGWLIGFTVG